MLTLEPWRATAFPVVKDLVVDRGAFDRIIAAGGFISATTGGAPDGNAIPVPKENADLAMDAAACIGCGACVAACPNASAMLFVAAKVSHLAQLPQGQPERPQRVRRWSRRWTPRASATAPTTTSARRPARKASACSSSRDMNADYLRASLTAGRREAGAGEGSGG